MPSLIREQRMIPVHEQSQIGEARRVAARLSEATTLKETDRGRLAIVVTELATNLVRHAGGGHMFLRALGDNADGAAADEDEDNGVEVIAIDRGPGMDVPRCMQDGFSTGGTAGQGMGAAQRQSAGFDVYADAAGTAIRCRVTNSAPGFRPARQQLELGVAQSSAPGEHVCGDAWCFARDGAERAALMVIDGLGHGQSAADAARAAQQEFDEDPFCDPEQHLSRAHRKLAGTRGAAVAVALVDAGRGTLRYAGIGNIAGTLINNGETRGLVSHNGTIGHQLRKIQALDYPWTSQTTLVMHSDGLQTRWTTEPYPGILQRHPSILAAILHRDFTRGRDDSTATVLRLVTIA